MKTRIHKFCVLIVIVGIIGRMTLRFFAPEHIFAIQLLWGIVGVAAFLCLWATSEMRKEEKEKNGRIQKDTTHLFLTDFILVVLYILASVFMLLK